MFRKELQEKLEKIFGFKKTTYDAPSDQFEQDTLFIHIVSARSNTGQGKARARVEGVLTVFSKKDSLPFGYFNKRIQLAKPELTKDLFFFDIDTDVANSPARVIDISERQVSFMYLYSAQFDPDQGQLTSVDFCPEGEE